MTQASRPPDPVPRVGRDARQELGRAGEDAATRYLQDHGMVVLDRNWRCRDGEIDIVALEEASDTLVIVEVKTRRSAAYGAPIEAVTRVKAARLRRLASQWLLRHPIGARRIRVDVVGILAPRRGDLTITHVQDATA